MLSMMFRKLQEEARLTPEDQGLLNASMKRLETLPAHADLIQLGDPPRSLDMVVDGWACRYKQLEDGRRQIIALLLPGDLCNPYVFQLERAKHAVATITSVSVARLAEKDVAAMVASSPTLNRAFWLEMLIDAEIQREWTVSLGRRTALERLAHLFCELLQRLRTAGLATDGECDMPLTQTDLGDALGLSSVHVNRTLQDLRAGGLIELKGKRLVVRDETALQALALFDPDYLHPVFAR